ncbi:MAG: tRNA1(Val) (adenine(37)-N6)-methyltransferase [Bacteroidales bacterium]
MTDDSSTQKVGTDSVLLGAWAPLPEEGLILDVGTGCGILALQAAQRTRCEIVGIDIHGPSVHQALANFQNSPWSHRLSALKIAMQDYQPESPFDAILCNPPYFSQSLKSPYAYRNTARHDEELPLHEFFLHGTRLLKPDGECFLCLQASELNRAMLESAYHGFFLQGVVNVSSREQLRPYLVLLAFRRKPGPIRSGSLIIKDKQGNYTEAYRTLTRDFYLYF